jgi:nucleotide-binding universal stress UspA family protein
MIPIRRILVPTDFSEPAGAALQYAKTLATEFKSELHLLHVFPEPYIYPWGTEGASLPLADLLTQAEDAAKERLQQLIPPGDPLLGRVTTQTVLGAPFDRILHYIDEHDIDLVVMGTHGRGMMGHLLLGSVAERVVRKSSVPVLTVHSVRTTTK